MTEMKQLSIDGKLYEVVDASARQALDQKLSNEAGSVARENIADLAINNAKLNYESVSNAKIAAGTIQTDRLAADALTYLTGGPYLSVTYDGSARADITQGNHVYALRLIDDSSRNLRTWLLNHSTYNGTYLYNGTDIEGPLKLLGRTDFIGGIHGDEQLVSMRMIADGVDITGTANDLSGVKTLSVYVTSTVNDENGGDVLFTREKVLTFSGMSLTVENRWTYTGADHVYVVRWPGCGLYSTYIDNTVGYTTNKTLTLSMDATDEDSEIKEVSFWVSGTKVTLQALRGMNHATYVGFVEKMDGSARIKAYFDTIHAPDGHLLKNGDVLDGAYIITIGEQRSPASMAAVDAAKLCGKEPSYYYAGPPNYEYAGKDLSTVFASLADLHAAVSAGDFSNIRVGDYWPITLSGNVYDYADSTSKACNCTFQMEVAGINTYINYSDATPPNHLVMCSRNLMPFTMKYRSADTTWYSASETNPWRGSHLYQTLNNSTNGALALLNNTDFASYIYSGQNGSGMRFLLETKASNATSATSWEWGDRGKLFLPTEREVWGQDVWSEHSWGGGAAVQWPIFSGSLRHVVKGLGGSGRGYWWVQSSRAGSASAFCLVHGYGFPSASSASHSHVGAPLCFLFV